MAKCDTVKLKPVISVLPNDYSSLQNKPSIDGIVLNGEVSSQSLNLLSSNKETYETIDISTIKVEERQNFEVVVLGADKPMKLGIDKLLKGKENFTTVTEIDKDRAIGSYQFVEKK